MFEDDEMGQSVRTNEWVTSTTVDTDDDELYCPVCRHFGCSAIYGDEHKPVSVPCGRYDCCIN